MALTERLAIIITANGAQAMGEFNKVGRSAERSLKTMEQGSQRVGAQLTRAGAMMIGFGAVMATGMFMAARAAEEQNRAELELANTIQNIPALAGANTSAFLSQASAMQQVTVADDAAVVSMQAMLGTFHLTQEEILSATPLVVDYARKFGVDLTSAAKQVGKALAGNIGTLQRNGVMIDENAYATDRFSAVMDALRENAGGFAEAEGATFTGQLEIMKNRLGEVAEGVGGGAVDAFSNLLGAVEGVTGALDGAGSGGQAFLGQLLTYGSVGSIAVGALSLVAGGLVRFAGQAKVAADAAYMLYLRVRTSPQSLGQMATSALGAAAALAVVAVAIQRNMDRQSRAAAQNDAVSAAMEGATGSADALAEGLDALESQSGRASGDELRAAMAAAGISMEDLAAGAEAGGGALDGLIDRMAATGQISADTRSQMQQMSEFSAFEVLKGDFDAAASEADRTRSAVSFLSDELSDTTAASEAEQALAGLGEGAQFSAEMLDELSAAMQEFFGQTFGVQRAVDDVAVAQTALMEALIANGPNMLGSGEAARENRAAFDEWSVSVGTAAQAILANGGSAAEAAAYIDQQRAALARSRDMGLISSATFDSYSGILDGIRATVATSVTTPGAQSAIDAFRTIDSLADRLSREVRISLVLANASAVAASMTALASQASNGGRFFGGPVPGASSEAVPMTLHGGEYVLSADVVDRIKSGRSSRGAGMGTGNGDQAGGGGGNQITVNVSGVVGNGDEVARHVLSEIRKLERAVAA